MIFKVLFKGIFVFLATTSVFSFVVSPFSFNNRYTSIYQRLASSVKVSATTTQSIVELFFENWNKRDIDNAINCFVDNCEYEDSQFPKKFIGRAALKNHLTANANAFPDSTIIKIDKVSNDIENGNVAVQWHIEVNGIIFPASRGCSMYTIDKTTGLILNGIDVLEPFPKVGGIALPVLNVFSKLNKFYKIYIPQKK